MERLGDFWIRDPQLYRGRWDEAFGRAAPLYVEIGCGKGAFISEMASAHPHINFVAVEKIADVLIMAMESFSGLANLRFVLGDAQDLPLIFGEGECEKIFLNFSDPWPKRKHAPRRLTHPDFLLKYKTALSEHGVLEQKTDSRPLFEFSLSNLKKCGFRIEFLSEHLYKNGAEGAVMTEYEKRFYSEGKPIYKLSATPG